ncbi:hypothetical protein HOK51_06275 [Candidatus Woesearchaeota archaeon]|jgi:endonuclease III|nr:hypothetical protein [Candidatus Woesearchaeota archaeon]MBT6519432.1 hypothetical protein [Candidatus Woesearchaeota archaeon]MBT7368907.1 hypothetical protein [Candidatus Woesearchaeota archaeon]
MDINRAKKIVEVVLDSYDRREGLFTNLVNIEENIPLKSGDKQKSLFLFFVTNIDHGTKSKLLYAGAQELWKKNKTYFDPKQLVKFDKDELAEILANYLKPRYPNVAAIRWQKNSELLLNKYNGDPRNMFDAEEANVVLKRIKEFRGMGEKTGGLFFRSMVNTLGYEYWDINEIMQPVDVHDMRLSYILGVLDREESKNIHRVRVIWNEACSQAGKNWLLFDKALWLIGSEGCNNKKCDECSVGKFCKQKADTTQEKIKKVFGFF